MAGKSSGSLCYWLGKTMYISLTNRACGLALLPSRGPSFVMPPASGFAPLEMDAAAEPSVAAVVAAVEDAYAHDPRKENPLLKTNDGREVDPGVVFAGLGDPLLRVDAICQAAELIRDAQPGVPIRVYTNGLAAAGDVQGHVDALRAADISSVCVALNAHTPKVYDALMLTPPAYSPPVYNDLGVPDADARALAVGLASVPTGAGFGAVCNFVSSLAEAGVQTTVTCVEAPGVNVVATRQLALALGAIDFKVRSWHA